MSQEQTEPVLQTPTFAQGRTEILRELMTHEKPLARHLKPRPNPPAPAPFVFPSLRPYIRAAAIREGLNMGDTETLRLVGNAEMCWQAKQIQQQLGYLPRMSVEASAGRVPAQAPVDSLAMVWGIRRSLAVLLAAVDDAIEETADACGLEIPA